MIGTELVMRDQSTSPATMAMSDSGHVVSGDIGRHASPVLAVLQQ